MLRRNQTKNKEKNSFKEDTLTSNVSDPLIDNTSIETNDNLCYLIYKLKEHIDTITVKKDEVFITMK